MILIVSTSRHEFYFQRGRLYREHAQWFILPEDWPEHRWIQMYGQTRGAELLALVEE